MFQFCTEREISRKARAVNNNVGNSQNVFAISEMVFFLQNKKNVEHFMREKIAYTRVDVSRESQAIVETRAKHTN